jgi:addiction module HigA family antidote
MRNKRKRRPTHPGELLREETLPAAGLTQTELAARLGVSRRTVHELIHERRPVTPDMAHRLARVFNTTPEFWLRLQQAVDIWDALEANRRDYDRIKSLRGKAA